MTPALLFSLKRAFLPRFHPSFPSLGNEDDYIVVSLVRTKKLGFLDDQRRVNVMLTRCKKGLIICAKRSFVEGPAQDCLVGRLAREIGPLTWLSGRDVQHKGALPFC